MKTQDIARQYGLNNELLEEFIAKSHYSVRRSITGMTVVDSEDVEAIVAEYKIIYAGNLAEEERLLKTATDKKTTLANMLITSGFNFDGYTITKYSGYISGDDAISVNRGWAIFGMGIDVKDRLLGTLVEIRRNALAELKEAAYDLGCNAVIGVDFDYMTLDPQTANLTGGTTYQPYVFAVTANGNAVVIEKNI